MANFKFIVHLYLAERLKVVLVTFGSSRSALVVGFYLAMVFLSPYIRQLYQPFQLRRILIGHNFICSIMNLYAIIFLLHGLWEVYLIIIYYYYTVLVVPHLNNNYCQLFVNAALCTDRY